LPLKIDPGQKGLMLIRAEAWIVKILEVTGFGYVPGAVGVHRLPACESAIVPAGMH
jgi:hypothetical protein